MRRAGVAPLAASGGTRLSAVVALAVEARSAHLRHLRRRGAPPCSCGTARGPEQPPPPRPGAPPLRRPEALPTARPLREHGPCQTLALVHDSGVAAAEAVLLELVEQGPVADAEQARRVG